MNRIRSWLFVAVMLLLLGCKADPMERTADRIDALVELMESHKDRPDDLFKALETYINDNAKGFEEDRAALLALDSEELLQLSGKHEDRLQARLMDLMDVTLEIQDRLRHSPDKLKTFQKLLERLR